MSILWKEFNPEEDAEECQGCSLLFLSKTLNDDSLCEVCEVEEAPPSFGKQPASPIVTTNDCREFLSDYFSKNPQLLDHSFSDPSMQLKYLEKDIAVKKASINPKKWKRGGKYSATNVNSDYYDEEYLITCEDNNTMMLPAECFLTIRRFYLDGTEGGVSYFVLEDRNNQLWLGEDCGD
jgi:hypothetical protein